MAIVVVAYGLFASGSSINFLAVAPAKWLSFLQLAQHFETNLVRHVAQFAVFWGVFTIAASAIGYPVRQFVPGFVVVYVLSLAEKTSSFSRSLGSGAIAAYALHGLRRE